MLHPETTERSPIRTIADRGDQRSLNPAASLRHDIDPLDSTPPNFRSQAFERPLQIVSIHFDAGVENDAEAVTTPLPRRRAQQRESVLCAPIESRTVKGVAATAAGSPPTDIRHDDAASLLALPTVVVDAFSHVVGFQGVGARRGQL